ncbi:hybrid sensor histidine kinase/response regulator [Pararhodobacter aggregans]
MRLTNSPSDSPQIPPDGGADPRASLLEPLIRLAAGGRVLAFASILIATAALVLTLAHLDRAAMVAATASATLALLAIAAMLVRAYAARRRRFVGAALARSAATDPDPVVVTDLKGRPCAANPAAGGMADPAERLHGWCVDAAQVVDSLLVEVRRREATTREFWRQDRGMRVSLHSVEGAFGLIVWHFSTLMRGGGRGLDVLGLPVVTREGVQLRLNPAARAAFMGEEAEVLEALEQVLDAGNSGVFALSLPGGRGIQAVSVPSRDGLADIVLLPPHTLPEGGEGSPAPPASVFEEIPVALMQIDAEGRVGGSNRLARQLLGLSAEEAPFFSEVVEGLGRPVPDWLDDARAGRALGRPEVLRATLPQQETFVQIILRRATDQHAEGALVAVISDATELKSLEARFVQSQKMQAIGQLAGGIAHDFNNLLTAISGHCDLLLLNRDRFDPDYNDLLQIHQNANRAAALVRQLLAFSRKQTLKPEVVSLESLLEELTHLLTRLVGERITLALSHDPALTAIRADKRQLEQVIMNLVVNARDAMPMGGTIRIETEALHLLDEHEHGRARLPAGDYALIRVIDQGIGIPADIIDKIFEPFFTTKKIGEGTGLGLSTAYGIVKQMGGYIFAESIEGAGTTFTLYFAAEPADALTDPVPAAESPEEPAAPLPPAEPAPKRGPARPRPSLPPVTVNSAAILLVEDEAPVRAFAARALRLQGYQVFEAQDGEQALDFLRDPALRVDLFVTDVIMPGIDGPGWVAEALEDRPGTPVVFVSGYTEDTLSAAMGRIPGSVFLGKPFSLKDLSEMIARELAKRDALEGVAGEG